MHPRRTDNLRIRDAHPDDLPAMIEIWKGFIDFHAERDSAFRRAREGHNRFGEYIAERLSRNDWCILVAISSEEIIGHAVGAIQNKPPVFVETIHGYIQDIAVIPERRHQGVGTRLFETMTAWFKAKGVDRIELEAAATNEVSQAFWKRMGCRTFMTRLFSEI